MKDPLDTGPSLLYVVVILPSLVVGHARYFRDTSDTNEEKLKVVVVFLMVDLYSQKHSKYFRKFEFPSRAKNLSQGVKT